MRRLIYLVLIFFKMWLVSTVQAQQDPIYSMYMFNAPYYNPGSVGAANYISAFATYRKQWVSFPGAPMYQNFNAIVPLKEKNLGFGLNLTNDQQGARRQFRMDVQGAYSVPLYEAKLAFGISAGFQQIGINGDRIQTEVDDPNLPQNGWQHKPVPDFGFGAWYEKQRYYVGLSALHLNGPGTRVTGYTGGADEANYARHYYLTSGYLIEIDEHFTLHPSVLYRYSESRLVAKTSAMDLNLRLEYEKTYWAGLAHRLGDAVILMTGLNIGRINPEVFQENIKIGYSIDITSSRIPGYNNGTHEIFIGYEYVPKVKRAMPKFQ